MKKTRVVNINKESCDIYIGRGTKWGNPFKVGRDGTREEVIAKHKEAFLLNEELLADLHELEGKTLGCHCKPKPCHGDTYVELIEQKEEQ